MAYGRAEAKLTISGYSIPPSHEVTIGRDDAGQGQRKFRRGMG